MMQMRRITRIKKFFGEIRLLRAFRIKNLRLCTAMFLFFAIDLRIPLFIRVNFA